ncbi:MAG: hypothetical protein IJ719_17200 [Clostridia bacterium]|nr:hypothetical protein [Clostridia bacterium]
MRELCLVSRDTLDFSGYFIEAEKIAALHGVSVVNGALMNNETAKAIEERQQKDAQNVKDRAILTIPEMEKLAREALSVRYGFTEEQSECLKNEEENGRYLLFGPNEIPCYEFYFTLGYDEDGYQGSGTGIYTVKANVENGTIEDILYDSALAENG